MNLEFNQGLHDDVIVNSGNVSASLDPKQVPNDANDGLIKSAAKFAAGKELGLSEEEVLSAISRQARAEMRAQAPGGYAGTGMTVQEVQNDLLRRMKQAEAQLGKFPKPSEAEPAMVEGLTKTSRSRRRFDDGEFTEDDLTRYTPDDVSAGLYPRVIEDETPEIKRLLINQLNSGQKPDISNLRVNKDEAKRALRQIDFDLKRQILAERQKGNRGSYNQIRKEILQRGYTPTPREKLPYSRPQEQTDFSTTQYTPAPTLAAMDAEAMRVLGSTARSRSEERVRASADELIASEAARMRNPAAEEQNYENAAADALRELRGGALDRQANVDRLYFPTDAEKRLEMPLAVAIGPGQPGSYHMDTSTGAPIRVEDYAISGANTPDSGQMLNAPQGATEFVAHAMNEGSQFTRNQQVANVDIGSELRGFEDAVARFGQKGNFEELQGESNRIRTIDALDKAVSAVTAIAAEKNIPMYRVNKETGKRSRVNPGEADIYDVMSTLKIGPAQQERIGVDITS